jgi:transposase
MNVTLARVVSDVTGVTGRRIIRTVLDGERDPRVLARLRDRRCQHDEETIARSLAGTWRSEHLFALRQAVELLDFYQQQIVACDREVEVCRGGFADKTAGHTLPAKPRTTKPNRTAPTFDVRTHLYRLTGVDLTRIDGIDAPTASKSSRRPAST